ncbi:DUF4439 domain-containing protein [Haloglycomyces albus]|uniref:DUF4439 domain-containing protein n=1 Tax=Haloglycomyces albus TaxID=526067 RepID=UPI00046D8535|nr:DUF4439 domain-containing protein [Haloglycomyces albus]
MTDHHHLDRGLQAEYAAIYAAETLLPEVSGAERSAVEQTLAAHRELRLALFDVYDQEDWSIPKAEPAYEIDDSEDTTTILVEIEQRVATTWRAGCASGNDTERKQCVAALETAAINLVRLKASQGSSIINPWPGRTDG